MEKAIFDHSKESMVEATGVNLEALNEKMSNTINEHNEKGKDTMSELVETISNDFTPVELALIVVMKIIDESKSPTQRMMEMLMSGKSED